MMTRLWLWLRSILFRTRLEREMQEEMAAHLRTATERFEASGLAPEAPAPPHTGSSGTWPPSGRGARRAGGRGSSRCSRISATASGASPHPVLRGHHDRRVRARHRIQRRAVHLHFVAREQPGSGMTRDDSLVRIRGVAGGGDRIGREFSYPEYATTRHKPRCSRRSPRGRPRTWSSAWAAVVPKTLLSGAATFVTANYFQVLGVRPATGTACRRTRPIMAANRRWSR